MKQNVAILGASNNSERYSYKAFKMLQNYNHNPIPVSPKIKELEGVKVFSNLTEISMPIDTLTMYVGPELSTQLKDDIIKLNPKRVIFNPGTENPSLQSELEQKGVHVVEACTLVLLRTNQFEKA